METSLRANALRDGIRAEILTVIWMILEAAVAVGAGVLAQSILLVAFGLDSVIELLSAIVLLWRLGVEARGDDAERVERVEHRATWVSAILLGLLCVYVLGSSLLGLLTQTEPEESWIGIGIALGAVVAMPLLAQFKRRINARLNSASMRADIAESVTCAYMASTVLAGLVLNAALGWWWAEYIAAVVLLFWLVRETREAFEAARGDSDE